MKALVILSRHDHHFLHCFYEKNELLWVLVSSSREKTPQLLTVST